MRLALWAKREPPEAASPTVAGAAQATKHSASAVTRVRAASCASGAASALRATTLTAATGLYTTLQTPVGTPLGQPAAIH